MTRKRHTNKHIEAAVTYAESQGWRFEARNGHAWARLFCAYSDRSGCRVSVYSTPRNPENHAKTIKKVIDKCQCEGGDDEHI